MKKHSLTIQGHVTSISLEDVFWEALKEEAAAQERSLASLVAEIDRARTTGLSSAIRVYLFQQVKDRAWAATERLGSDIEAR